jgi:chromosome partitioning protein
MLLRGNMIISIANQKGGVGKTTSTVNLGIGLNQKGYKTLLIDLDSQTDLTISLGIPETEFTIDDVLKGKGITKAIVRLKSGLHAIPASKELKSTQLSLSKTDILLKALSTIKNNYDFILIDTNPGMSILTVNAILVSDFILIPIIPEYLALRGLKDFMETIEQLNKRFDIKHQTIKILITNFDRRLKLNIEAIEMVGKHFKKELLKTIIRKNVALAEAPGKDHKDIFQYSKTSHGAIDYISLTEEIIKIVKGK